VRCAAWSGSREFCLDIHMDVLVCVCVCVVVVVVVVVVCVCVCVHVYVFDCMIVVFSLLKRPPFRCSHSPRAAVSIASTNSSKKDKKEKGKEKEKDKGRGKDREADTASQRDDASVRAPTPPPAALCVAVCLPRARVSARASAVFACDLSLFKPHTLASLTAGQQSQVAVAGLPPPREQVRWLLQRQMPLPTSKPISESLLSCFRRSGGVCCILALSFTHAV
jgi:hypothetical protein